MKLRFVLPVVLALCVAAASTFAASTSTTMSVSATVQASCSISPNPLNFATYDPSSSSPVHASTTFNYTCPNSSSPVISLSGVGGAGDGTGYKLVNGSNNLMYSLHSSSYSGTSWGNQSSYTVAGTGDGSQHTLTIYGVIAAGQSVPDMSYSDTITITFAY